MTNKPVVAILIGIQGSGKSTFCRQFLSDMVHVNLDTLRTRHREKELIQACFENGRSFAVDNTNPTKAEREKYISDARAHGYLIVGYFLESKLQACIARNNLRMEGRQMNFTELDKKMRVYEQSIDQVVVPGEYLVARLDGNRFTKLTKEVCRFEAPFDEKFRDLMVDTVKSLMNYGFRVAYGFTESDEISLLFHPDEDTFGRKVRKYNSILAGVASSAFSMALGKQAVFDCRMIPLPNQELVIDYFRWRQEDAHRNALNAHCYWMLRKNGYSVSEATATLEGKSVSYKNELLFQNGINFNTIPAWQKRGIGLYWDTFEKTGHNPIQKVHSRRSDVAENFLTPC